MIEAFLVINKAGLPLCQIKAQDATWDETLIGGFITAIASFGAETWQSGNLEQIVFHEKQIFLLHCLERRICILVTSLSTPPEISQACLIDLSDNFKSIFSELDGLKGPINSEQFYESFSQKGFEILRLYNAKVAESIHKGGEIHYKTLYSYKEIRMREKSAFILDKTILQTICNAGMISLTQLRKKIASFEEALGVRIDLNQIRLICERYIREGLIKQI